MGVNYRNGVAIAEIIVYVPSLLIAIYLCLRHGFNRSAGWMFLAIFCLARIIGPSMQLATIASPENVSLYTGATILQSLGLSPLELATMGLLSRLLDNINKSHHTLINTGALKLIELVILVGLILGIVGGTRAGHDLAKTGTFHLGSLSKASTALFIVSYAAIVVSTILVSFSVSHAEHGEKRIMVAVWISLPFLLVRLIYSALSTFAHNKSFSSLNGSVTILLCVSLIEEFIIVVVFEAVGLTLHKVPKDAFVEGTQVPESLDGDGDGYQDAAQRPSKAVAVGTTILGLAKKTFIGRIVTSLAPGDKQGDIEMQRRRERRSGRH